MLDRVPPHNLEAEQSILGAVFIENKAIRKISSTLTEEDFYKSSHKKIFTAMKHLHDSNESIDLITVQDYLQRQGQLEEVGGDSYIHDLFDFIPTSSQIKTHVGIVKEKAQRRALLNAAHNVIKNIDNDLMALRAEIKASLTETRESGKILTSKHLAEKVINHVEQIASNPGHLTGIPTGFKDIDFLTGGLQRSDLIIVAGRPGMGKSALAGNFAVNAATAGHSVGVFSLEMSEEAIGMRFLSHIGSIPLWNLKYGILGQYETEYITACASLADLPLHSCFTGNLTIEQIQSFTENMIEDHGIKLLIIDYLQLIKSSSRGKNREGEVSEISRTLKGMAKEFDIPVICLAQLNRNCETRENKRPLLSDLRESGAIEQDADVVMFLYRDDYYNDASLNKGVAECLFRKGRHIGTGDIKLQWQQDYVRFRDSKKQGLG